MTKEELRHDAFVEGAGRATSWLQHNFMMVLVAVVAVAVLVVGTVFFQQSRQNSQLQAGKLFFQATRLYTSGSYSEGLVVLDDLVSRYGGSAEGRAALYLSGASHLGLGENDRAIEQFQAYLDRNADGDYALSARIGLALAQESQGNLSAAVDAYKAIRGELGEDDPRLVQVALGQSRVLEAQGDFSAAIAALTPLSDVEDFTARQEIEGRLATLEALR